MQHAETHSQHLLRLQQMADIGSGISAAGRAAAAFLNRPVVQLIFRVEQVDLPVIRIQMAVPPVSCGINAVEKVHASLHALQDVCRGSHAHQVGGLVCRKIWHRFIQHVVHFLMGFSHREAADGIAVQLHLRDPLRMVDPDIRVNRPLIDAKQKLVLINGILQAVQPLHLFLASRQPAGGSRHGIFHILTLRLRRGAFVKGHGDGGSQIGLDAHALLRPHENLSSIHMGMEINAFLLDFSQRRQGKYLKSAGIREDGTVP